MAWGLVQGSWAQEDRAEEQGAGGRSAGAVKDHDGERLLPGVVGVEPVMDGAAAAKVSRV